MRFLTVNRVVDEGGDYVTVSVGSGATMRNHRVSVYYWTDRRLEWPISRLCGYCRIR